MNRIIALGVLLMTLQMASLIFGFGVLSAQNPGEVDATYGNDGINEFWLEGDGFVRGLSSSDVYELPGNKLLVAGATKQGCSGNWTDSGVLFVMDASGNLDTDYFDGLGYRQFSEVAILRDILPATDGDFYLLGANKMLKYNLETGIDASFGNDGFVNFINWNAASFEMDPLGNILVVGSRNNFSSPDNRDRILALYSPEGVPTSSFGVDGILSVYPTESADIIGQVFFDSAGRILVTGTSRTGINFNVTHVLVTRLLPNGDLDSTYAVNGRFEDDNFLRSDNRFAYLNDADELILSGGYVISVFNPNAGLSMLMKLDATGSVDTSFGTDGYTTFEFPFGSGIIRTFHKLPSGDFVMSGNSGYSTDTMFLGRCSEDGIFDSNFGTDGIRYYPIPNDDGYTVGSVVDGNKIVVFGDSYYVDCAQTKKKTWFRRLAIGELNDSCADAISLEVHPAGECPEAAVTGSTGFSISSGNGDCDSGAMRDVFYTFESGESGAITIDFHTNADNGYGLEILESCDGASVFCAAVEDTVMTVELSPNTLYILRVAADVATPDTDSFGVCLTVAEVVESTLSGTIDWTVQCVVDSAHFAFYSPQTEVLLFSAATAIGDGGVYSFPIDSAGSFDVLVSVAGFFVKGYSGVDVSEGDSVLPVYLIKSGDVNNSGTVNIIDFSLLGGAFGTQVGDAGFNANADLDCSGSVGLVDFSVLSGSFYLEDDVVPLE